MNADKISWSQIREFLEDNVASRDYRGILLVHRMLENAKSATHARELLDGLIQAHSQAAIKHGLPVEGGALIQLATGLSATAFAYAAHNSETLVVAGLLPVAAAAYNLLTAVRDRKRTDAPALIIKARGFVSSHEGE
jgi:hypothetical protein